MVREKMYRLNAESGITLGLAGVIENLANFKLNMIIHALVFFFLKHLQADLEREKTPNLILNINDLVKQVNEQVCIKCCTSFNF